MIRRAEIQDHSWIVAMGAEAYHDLGDYTRILPSWLEQPGVLAWIEHDSAGTGRGFAMLGFYTEEVEPGGSAADRRGLTADRRGLTADPGGHRARGTQQVVADLLALAVLPSHQRRGIGSKLLAHVIEVAERVGPASQIAQLRLTVAEDNVGAQRLYAHSGFHVVDGSATYDRGQRALRMVRPLGSGPAKSD